MIAIVLIALAAGCASALMFASIISGALISLLLFYLAPLPLMVAALGWGPLSATIGGIVAATGLGAIFGLPYCIAFVVTVALPAWWLGHLALLGRPHGRCRPSGNGAAPAAPALEWYPVGRILLWIAGFAALTTMAALLTLGSDADTITGALRSGLMRILGAARCGIAGDIERWVDALVIIAPAAAAIVAMMTLTLNLWLAAQDHRDVGTAAPALARSEERRTAADDAGGAVVSRSPSASPAGSLAMLAQIVDRRADDGLRAHRLCRAAHADAGARRAARSG